jgi:hypothetical protein
MDWSSINYDLAAKFVGASSVMGGVAATEVSIVVCVI